MAKYRKKPVVIEAMQYDGRNAFDIITWAHEGLSTEANSIITLLADDRLLVRTWEDPLSAMRGDWIIKGVKGEFYPCRNDIFLATYEPAGDETVQRLREAKTS